MKRFALGTSILLVLAAPTANAETFAGPGGTSLEVNGFFKVEGTASSSAPKIVAPADSVYRFNARNAYDPNNREPLPIPSAGPRTSTLSMQQIGIGVSKETDSAITYEARVTHRWRKAVGDDFAEWFANPDVNYKTSSPFGNADFFEKLIGISRPDLGTLRYGTQLSRSWSRSDSFTFPIGLSSQWADSGAGFGILPEALRYSSPIFEDGSGKLSFEVTLAQNKQNTELVDRSFVASQFRDSAQFPGATSPRLGEFFLQFSNPKNLIEFTAQTSTGAQQAAFGKAALVGWIGDPDSNPWTPGTPRNAGKPSQSIVMLQGNHWPNTTNMLTWGLRRSQWSGSAASCNPNPTYGCYFGIEPGFNTGLKQQSYQGYRASTLDLMGGWSHYRGLFTYTLAGVYFGKANSDNPIEWGQSNSAWGMNAGIYRKLPEIQKGLGASIGISSSNFQRLGPAPLSMPGNTFLGPNSLYNKSGQAITIGATWVF